MKKSKKRKTVPAIITACFLTPFIISGITSIIEGIICINKGVENAVVLLVFGVFVLIFISIIGAVFIVSFLCPKDHTSTMTSKERLYGKGKLMQATVGNVMAEPGTNYSKVYCYFEDANLNKFYRFVSGPFDNCDAMFFREGMLLDVYVNPHNENDYYVAIEDVGATPVEIE